MGATATGKTALALEIAEAVAGEIVSVDSMQVYRGMDIGTAKATADERRRVAHHVIDVADPDDPLDARRYAQLADAAVADIERRGRLPVIVGGTGLWLRALLHGLMPAPPADRGLRDRFEALARSAGPAALHARLAERDPASALRIHRNDSVRVIRALEVLELTGRPISEHHREHEASEARYQVLALGLRHDREALYVRIDARTVAMFDAGFAQEVQALLDSGFDRSLRPMGALGYKHVCAALAGEIPLEDAVRLTQRDTRRYAKRQRTWFAKDPAISWLDAPYDPSAVIERVRAFRRGGA